MNLVVAIILWILAIMFGGSLLFASLFFMGYLNDVRRERKFNRQLKRLLRDHQKDD